MKRILPAFLLMITLAATCAAQMNYDLISPYLIYTKRDESEVPVLIDVLNGETAPDAQIIGGADGPTAIFVSGAGGVWALAALILLVVAGLGFGLGYWLGKKPHQ